MANTKPARRQPLAARRTLDRRERSSRRSLKGYGLGLAAMASLDPAVVERVFGDRTRAAVAALWTAASSLGRIDGARIVRDPKSRAHMTEALKRSLDGAYQAQNDGKEWRRPFPSMKRNDGDPVLLAWVAWASPYADDDMLAAVLAPREYGDGDHLGRWRLLDRVRQIRHRAQRI